jgi:photosystem II stability/assembly factor-like uncharacterized protein/predicted small integral membrane protein
VLTNAILRGQALRRRIDPKRLGPLAFGLVMLLMAVLWAWVEPRPGQFEPRPRLSSPRWWLTPTEIGSSNRPPLVLGVLRGIAVVPGSRGQALVAVGSDGILYTTDGGTHWKVRCQVRTYCGSEFLASVTFVNSEAGWAVGKDSTIVHTSDGGKTWNVQTNDYGSNFYGVTFRDANSGCAVGDGINGGGFLFCTSDGGTKWRAVTLPQTQLRSGYSEYVYSDQFLDERSGWVAGQQTIFRTTDGGMHWDQEFRDPRVTLNDMTLVDGDPISGWAVGGTEQGGATILRYTGESGWVTARISGSSEALPKTLHAVAFADRRSGWAVGAGGGILHTSDGGENWDAQSSGANANLWGVAFADTRSGWVAGEDGTILHTIDGGRTWTLQASAANWPNMVQAYHRWPAPIFWVLVACSIPLLLRSAAVEQEKTRTKIEELVSTDSPVVNLKDDRLGHRVLVERLTSFVSNPNTTPPLVISLQASWGMGKTSVMRMLQSNLKQNRAAVTVWFNAWHHRSEDQILAYLLETIQKEAIPPWVSPLGLRFRINLLFRRLSGRRDRLALVLLTTALVILEVFGVIPSKAAWQKPLSMAPVLLLGCLIWRSLVAFKSNPEKLVERSGGSLAQAVRELMTLPSLMGKTDVRQIFAENFKDVVEVLRPQRLVIFLDDLDRCRPEQVLQTLEAINFLSSAAECMIVLGADYEKVEALAAIQFEAIALREEENRGAQEVPARAVGLSLAYARNYLRKIVNLRLNLQLPAPSEFKQMLQEPSLTPAREGSIRRATIVAILVMTILGATWIADSLKTSLRPDSAPIAQTSSGPPESGVSQRSAANPSQLDTHRSPQAEILRHTLTETDILAAGENRWPWILGPPVFVLLFGLAFWCSRPKHREQAHDVQSFGEALERHVERICSRCGSPREVRRFLNYLRLVATGSEAENSDDIRTLRKRYGGLVDQYLVDLATIGRASGAGPEATAVNEYYHRQCDLFGLDPETFAPAEGGYHS